MWTRRSPDEIAEIERRRRRQKFNPLMPALLTVALLLICVAFGPRYFRSLFTSPRGFIVVLLAFGSLYLSQIIVGRYWLFGRPRFPVVIERNKICPVCRDIHITNSDVCSCGGRLEDLEYWKHVAD